MKITLTRKQKDSITRPHADKVLSELMQLIRVRNGEMEIVTFHGDERNGDGENSFNLLDLTKYDMQSCMELRELLAIEATFTKCAEEVRDAIRRFYPNKK